MKIRHDKVQIGDRLLIAKRSNLYYIKIIGITKNNSLKYRIAVNTNKHYFDTMEFDESKFNKTRYLQAWTDNPKYLPYYYLLGRENE